MRTVTTAILALAFTATSLHAQAQKITQIAASLHVLVLLEDGTVAATGENRSGQLGRPKAIRQFMPPGRVDLPGKAIQVAAGDDDASYALLEDGTVWAWGRGVRNNLGISLQGETERHTPLQIPGLSGVSRIAASYASVMAVMRDGSVRAWGELPSKFTGGQEILPGVATPTVIDGLTNVVDIAGGPAGGYALTRDGRVYAWGSNHQGALGIGEASKGFQGPVLIPALSDVVSIATVAGAAAAVTRDGRVWTWGGNQQAGLGRGTRADTGDAGQPAPAVLPGIADAAQVKAGTFGRHFIVKRRNGALIGWGNSDWGQLGAGISGAFQPNPTPIKLAAVEDYWLGGNYSFARTKDGSIWFWGESTAARPLLGASGNQRVPAQVPVGKLVP